MVNIICEVSKYLILLFMILYTIKCFSSMVSADPKETKKKTEEESAEVPEDESIKELLEETGKESEGKNGQADRIRVFDPRVLLSDTVFALG